MTPAQTKQELMVLLQRVHDPDVLEQARQLLHKAASTEPFDLTDEQWAGIEAAIAQMERGEYQTHDAVMAQYRNRFPDAFTS